MDIRFPRPLQPGDTIGVTAPSSGVPARLQGRLDMAVTSLRARGFHVEVGDCMDGRGVVSAPKAQRAAELTRMLTDPAIRAVVPPWGGELAMDLLDLLDWDALAAAEPTWTVGFSDSCSWMLPLTLRLGWATIHGTNLMDTPYLPEAGLLHWTDLAAGTGPIVQVSPGRFRTGGHDDWETEPTTSRMSLDGEGGPTVLGGGGVDVTGRLIGGCLEIMSPISATPFGDVPGFGREHLDEGLIVFLEASGYPAHDVARMLHGLRLAGWFEHASAVLIGRSAAPASVDMTQHEAVADALLGLDLPIVLDVDCGHVQPMMALVAGASARVVVERSRCEITQIIGQTTGQTISQTIG